MDENESLYARSLGNWLQVNCDTIKTNNNTVSMKCLRSGRSINGLLAVTVQLAKQSSIPNVMGENLGQEAQVRQWLEYTLWVNKLSNNSVGRRNLFEVLNQVLSTRTYLVGNERTLADVALYKVLHRFLVEMTYMEKEKLMHLGRWFDFIQGDKLVRQSNSVVLLGRPLL